MISRLSIAAKLPLAMAALLALVSGGVTAMTYSQVRGLVVQVASDRLDQAASHMADLLGTSAHQRLSDVQALAAEPGPGGFLRAMTEERREALLASWTRYLRGQAGRLGLELLDADGRRVLATGEPFPEVPAVDLGQVVSLLSEAEPRIGPYARQDGEITYWVGAPVLRAARPVGYLLERRRVTSSASIGLLTALIGDDARMFLGNAGGTTWIDLADTSAGTGIGVHAASDLVEHDPSNGVPAFLRSAAIAGTPWLVAVGLPRDPILAPARRFLTTAVAGSALLVVGGALVGWVVSRRLTGPLTELTEASEAIAAARAASRINVRRSDELGRLAASFNTMADEVQHGRARLEALVADLENRVAERTAALETTNRELEAFSYSVSHDLRAPLRAIHGFSRIVLEEHGRHLSPDARRYLQLVSDNTTRMGALIDDLLTFSRLGRQALKLRRIAPAEVARLALDDLRGEQEARRVEIRIDDLPPCEADPALLRHVFVNLLSNALKFTRHRDPAVIEVGCTGAVPPADLAAAAGDGYAYYVRDNGTGFDMRYATKLFGVFQRLHRQDEYEGTGVGLAIVERIISRHGGRVWAEARPDRGATFFFVLAGGNADGVDVTR